MGLSMQLQSPVRHAYTPWNCSLFGMRRHGEENWILIVRETHKANKIEPIHYLYKCIAIKLFKATIFKLSQL